MRRRSPLPAASLAALRALAAISTVRAEYSNVIGLHVEPVCIGQTVAAASGPRSVVAGSGDYGPALYPDGATLTLSLLSIEQTPGAHWEIAVVDPTVVLPDDWTTLPGGTQSVDTFAYEVTVTGLEETTGEDLPDGPYTRANFEVSSDGIVEPLSLIMSYIVVDCSPTPTPAPPAAPAATGTAAPTEAAAPAGSTRPTPPQTDAVAASRATPATGPLVGVLIVILGIIGVSAVVTRRLRPG